MKKKISKIIAVFLALNIFFDAVYPTAALALTGGPKQPEVEGFTPIGTSEMVNTFSGDFNYNIPLMDVGGYPINLSYQSGVTMDQEASWVGLGWSLNPGVINRSMRSLPDDFDGDEITKEFNIKPNTTYGVKFFPDLELAGVKVPKGLGLQFGLGLTYNNYTGYGFSASMDLKLSSTESGKTGGTVGLGLSAGSEEGLGISPSLSFSKNVEKRKNVDKVTNKIGLSFNSRGGLQALTLSSNFSKEKTTKGGDASSISFASPTFTPSSGHSMINTNLSFAATLGGQVMIAHANGRLEGFFAGQFLKDKTETFPAYGYINSHNAVADKALLDFNREKDGAFNENIPALPLSNFTYDLYNVSGQGIGGMYRAHRSDVGILYDSKVLNISAGANFPGIEIGAGSVAHPGINVSLNQSNSTSGKWEKDNEAASVLGFQSSTNDPLYESAYFKQAGEKNAESDERFFNDMGGFEPVRIALNHNPESVPTEKRYTKYSTNLTTTTRASRARRNEVISLLSAKEAKSYGDIRKIERYEQNSFIVKKPDQYKNIFQPNDTIVRDADYRSAHHTSQITTYRSDGAKYVYGIPAYNRTQEESTFAIQDLDFPDPFDHKTLKGISQYAINVDDTKNNHSGLDHYFDRTVIPAYAHSYLLTEILSADYVDVTGNGPTDDDLGTYTKINYSRTTDDYKWRVPYSGANFNEGFKSIPGDDKGDNKGSYIYGEKELWYIHSIETKNYVATFKITNRADGFGVAGKGGTFSGASNSRTKKLKEISLYSKQDLLKQDPLNGIYPTPLKTVHFEYEYSLCPGIDNNMLRVNSSATVDDDLFPNQGGKLTLKKVYFTYGNSAKGKLSPYVFNYDSYNPAYNLKGYDRWGNFKNNTIEHPTAEFPYTDQTFTSPGYYSADRDAFAWHMTSIQLSSGGTINVNYEADDYAYVQDKRAMQMFKVVAVTSGKPELPLPTSDINKLYNDGDKVSRNYLIFEVPNGYVNPSDVGKAFFREKDGKEIENLYFRFKMDLSRVTSGVHAWEYVPGYAQIDNTVTEEERYGFFNQGPISYGWVKLRPERIKDKINRGDANPISQAAWCFTKMNLPLLAYGQKRLQDGAFVQIVKSIANTLKQLITLPNGFYNQMRLEGMAQKFDLANSFIRLYNPVNKKKGGGCRVKRLALSDNWQGMTGSSLYENSEYGQVYEYTTKDEYGNNISSGVAAYEPLMGGDENPFREPVNYEISHPLAASDEFYQEKPYGESFFPGASVGYSKVTVKNIQQTNVKRHAAGAVVHAFYTAKDFPTITQQTTMDAKRVKPNAVLKLLKIRSRDFMTASQGFVVELNDMHGKPKGTYVYAEGNDKPISGVKYIYKTSVKTMTLPDYVNHEIKIGTLDNQMLVMERDGKIANKMVGVDYDFVTDMRQQETVSRTAGVGGNLEAFLLGIFPGIVPSVLPSYAQERVRFRSAVTTKVINRYGILDETVAYDQGSIVSTKNKMLDAETGEVLLTETKNQFNDPIFSFSYPAHIAYEGMGPAYKNIGVTVDAEVSNPSRYFVPGDEVAVYDISTGDYLPKAWIKKVTTTLLQAVDRNGFVIDLSGKRLRVLRSGRRNQQSTSIGSIVSKKTPLSDKTGDGAPDVLDINASIGILTTDAKEFSDQWGLFCECGIVEGAPFNPYVKGTRGNWRAVKSYAQLTGRTQAHLNKNTNVREDGIYTSFTPFWKPAVVTTDPWQKSVENWQKVSEVTIYSPYGMELENKDALGIYSSAVYGYNNTLPLAVAANAQYKEIAFDSFEDYDFNACKADHFSYKTATPTNDKLMRTKSHTGKTSIKVAPNSELQIKKTLIKCDVIINN